jgi:hypothetical protein
MIALKNILSYIYKFYSLYFPLNIDHNYEEDGTTRILVFNYHDANEICDLINCHDNLYHINGRILTNKFINLIAYHTEDKLNHYFSFGYVKDTYYLDEKDCTIKHESIITSKSKHVSLTVISLFEKRPLRRGDVLIGYKHQDMEIVQILYDQKKIGDIKKMYLNYIMSSSELVAK